MADDAGTDAPPTQITFTIKSSTDAKYTLTVPETMTVLDLKSKLSTSEYADVPAERQRLIYSGRVMKDPDQLSIYKIKDGNTIHMVKSAQSSQRTQQSNQTVPGAGSAPSVPQMAAGTGNDPLAGLTGARYAGLTGLPSAESFGPDGGSLGPDPEELARQLDNPMFAQQMNEMLDNPQIQQMILNNPMMQQNPMMREMLRNPEMRRMLFNPDLIRQSMRMQQQMGGRGLGGFGGAGGGGNMPAPGATDTTPESGNTQSQGAAAGTGNQQQQNPFAPLFGAGGAGGGLGGLGGMGGGGPDIAQLLSAMSPPGTGSTNNTSTSGGNTDSTRSGTQSTGTGAGTTQPPPNPFGSLFGGAGTDAGAIPGAGAGGNPFADAMRTLQENPELAQRLMQSFGGGGLGGAAPGGTGEGGFNPFAALGGMGGMGGGGAPAPQDTRPPEEQYASQLQQLNDMGFYDFQQNVRALRMSGGRVEGAIEMLLSGSLGNA